MERVMIKKILFVLVFVSCSNNTTSPDSSNNGNNSGVTPPTVDKEEEELIKKYGIDISQEDAVISQKIEENLKAYFAEKNSYRVILTGTPKDYSKDGVESLASLIYEAAVKINVSSVDVDIKNIDLKNGAIESHMFAEGSSSQETFTLNLIFPENKIRTIEKSSFFGLYNTKEIALPDSVITIKESAFIYSSIERVTLGNGLQEIGTFAFMGVDNLKEIIIPDSVKSIGMQAFALSQQLTTLTYLGTNPNNINDKGDVFLGSTKLTTLIVPNAENDKDEGWKTFLGGNFTTVTKKL